MERERLSLIHAREGSVLGTGLMMGFEEMPSVDLVSLLKREDTNNHSPPGVGVVAGRREGISATKKNGKEKSRKLWVCDCGGEKGWCGCG